MDTHMETPLLLAQPAAAEPPKTAAGRLPLMAFVDGESEQVLQEAAVLLGRCVIMRGGIRKATEYLTEQRSPHLLIVDISGINAPLSEIHALADVCEPGTKVVALGDHNDIALYRDLIEAGVTNYIVKPLTRDVLETLLNPKPSRDIGRSGLKLGKVISFTGARGGVGTTTLAANLAWHLANKQGRRVALVDLDLQRGDCAMLFNVENMAGFRDALHHPMRMDAILLDRIMTQVGERLFILGCVEPLDENVQCAISAIDALFSVLRSQFQYVIVDVPRMPGPGFHRALEIADRRVIVVDPTMRSMRDAVRIAHTFENDQSDAEIRLSRNAFVVNRIGEGGQYALPLKDITDVLQSKPASLIPFLPKQVTPAAHHALIAASRRGKFTDGLAKLASEISGIRPRRDWRFWRGAR